MTARLIRLWVWLRTHDAEVFCIVSFAIITAWSYHLDPDKFLVELLYVLQGCIGGSYVVIVFIKYFQERVNTEE